MYAMEYSMVIHEWGGEVVAVHEVFRKEGRCDPTRPGRTDAAYAARKEPAHHGHSDPVGLSIGPTYPKSWHVR
jgi:hypothetical protein